MGEVRKLSIELSEDLASKLNDAVISGGYPDIGTLIGDLLLHWEGDQPETPEDIARIRGLIEEGLASGDAQEVTDEWFEDIKRQGHERVAAIRAAGQCG